MLKPNYKKLLEPSLLIIFLLSWFSILMPWNKLPDPDAFYHATMAKLTYEQGAITSFPWLDLTTLGRHFADQHYLFHVLQIPFVNIFGLTQGSRLSSITLALICMMVIYIIFRLLKLKPAWLWAVLLSLLYPFSVRLILGKASPLAILLWMISLALTSLILINKKNISKSSSYIFYFLFFIFALFFSLSHGGWIILPLSTLILFMGHILYEKALFPGPFKLVLYKLPWVGLLAGLLGLATGILLHPGRRELLSFLWVQVIKIGVMTPSQAIPMGQEWASANIGELLATTSIFLLIIILTVPGLIFAARKINFFEADDELQKFARLSIVWGILVAVLGALTLKSLRFAEYFQPALVIWVASLFQLIDWKKLLSWLSLDGGAKGRFLIPVIILIASGSLLARSVWNGYHVMHSKPMFMDNQYQPALQAISQQAQPGDRIFHAQWDEFPILLAHDQRFKYVAGMDPTFFYEADRALALDYFALTINRASTTQEQVWSVAHDRLQAKYALIDTQRWPELAQIFAQDKRYLEIGRGPDAVAYRIED